MRETRRTRGARKTGRKPEGGGAPGRGIRPGRRLGGAALLLLAVLIAGTASAARAASSYPNEPTGFRGIEWGTSSDRLPPDLLPDPNGRAPISYDATCYTRAGDRLVLGPVPLSSVDYVIASGRFAGAMLSFSGIPAFRTLKDLLLARFGFPSRRAPSGQDSYTWEGGRTLMHLFYDAWAGQGVLTLFSRALLDELAGRSPYEGREPVSGDIGADL
jgi:hypothetical protein